MDEITREALERAGRSGEGTPHGLAGIAALAMLWATHRRSDHTAAKYVVIGRQTGIIRGVFILKGRPVVCPRCGSAEWRLGGHRRSEVWVCSHGPVEFCEWLEDVVTFPRQYGESAELMAEAWPVYASAKETL